MTASQNTDLFVLGLVPRGVVFAGEAMCALMRFIVFLAVVRSSEWVLSPLARGEHGRTVHSSACAMHDASKQASRQTACRQRVCKALHGVHFQWRPGKAHITAFSAKSVASLCVCGWSPHDFGPRGQHSTHPYLVAQVIKGFAAELCAFDDKRWFLKSA